MTASLDDLLSMAVFARVVRERSFTAAAQALGLSKSVVSARVSALEQRLGARLLHRTTRKLSLTPEGERLYERVQHILSAADEATNTADALATRIEGRLRVTAPVGLGVMQLAIWIPEFSRAYPDVVVHLSLADRMVDVVADSYDVGIRMARQLADSTLLVRRIATERRVIVASPDYLARHPAPQTIEDLAGHSCLRLAGLQGEWTFPSPGGGPRRARASGPLVVDNIAVLRLATLEGMGLSVMLRGLVVDDLAAGRLVTVLDDLHVEDVGVFIVSPHVEAMPARVRAFIDFVAMKMKGTIEARAEAGYSAPPRTQASIRATSSGVTRKKFGWRGP